MSHNPIISEEGLADPTVIKVGDTYYLYPASDSPMGAFTKYEENPILCNEKTGVVGPGHHAEAENPEG